MEPSPIIGEDNVKDMVVGVLKTYSREFTRIFQVRVWLAATLGAGLVAHQPATPPLRRLCLVDCRCFTGASLLAWRVRGCAGALVRGCVRACVRACVRDARAADDGALR